MLNVCVPLHVNTGTNATFTVCDDILRVAGSSCVGGVRVQCAKQPSYHHHTGVAATTPRLITSTFIREAS